MKELPKRRVCMISEHASPLAAAGGIDSGGQNIYVAQVARHLARFGYEVDVFTRRDNNRLPHVVEWKDGIRIVNVDAGPPKFIRKEDLLPHMTEFRDYCLGFMRAEKPYDVVHANFWMSGLVAADIKRELGTPFVVTFHALGRVRRLYQGDADAFPDDRFDIEQRVIAEADCIIAECPQDREDLTSLYGGDAAKITIVPCGFDTAEFWPIDRFLARRELGLPKEEYIVLQLGRIVPRKGIDTAIRGFAHFVRRQPVSARLLVVGGEFAVADHQDEPEIRRLRQVADDEGVGGKVVFIGRRRREKLRYYYNAANVFVTTPWYEPFGITPLEAMACGLPVIGSNVGGIKYSVENGKTGYLVPARDEQSLAGILSYLYARPSVADTLGRNGVKRVNEAFTWPKVTRAIADIYEEVVATTARRPITREARQQIVDRGFTSIMQILDETRRVLHPVIIEAADAVVACFTKGCKVLICGNGGSAADAQHFVAEMMGRFKYRNRVALPALALTADSALITAWSNDAGYEHVFARQVQALGRPGDILICISTPGTSGNRIRAFEEARAAGLVCIALAGGKGGELAGGADIGILVPAADVQRTQEIHLFVLHLICELVEEQMMALRPRLPVDRAACVPGELSGGKCALTTSLE
jgi:phosphoheptose isomerase